MTTLSDLTSMTAPTGALSFKRHLDAYVVEGEAVYLVGEERVAVVNGLLAQQMAPLLDGTRTLAALHQDMGADVAPARIDAAVEALIKLGVADYVDPATDCATAGYFELAGVQGDVATARLQMARVRIETHGGADAAPVLEALQRLGITAGEHITALDADLLVALTDDYLQPTLSETNLSALAAGRPWMLARPSGPIIWLGPLFTTQTGCWTCLAVKLSANRQSLSYLQQRLSSATPLITTKATLATTATTAAGLIATEVAHQLAGVTRPVAGVRTLNSLTYELTTHELIRRPQCRDCGDPGLVAAQGYRPLVLGSQPKSFTADGGHRSQPPEAMLARHIRQVSPITGVVTGLAPARDTPDGLKVYCSGQNLSRQMGNLTALRQGLRSISAGKGKTEAQAKASAVAEAIERYCGVFRGDEARRRTRLADLGSAGIDPNSVMLYSEHQYAKRTGRPTGASVTDLFHMVPDPFDPQVETDFSPVWSLTRNEHVWLPTGNLYFSTPTPKAERFGYADSNGNAAGTSPEDAVLQGFFELVERDAVALWWYNRVQRPGVDLDAFADPYIDELRTIYRRQGREIWALDLTADLGIPVIGAFSRRIDKPAQDILIAFGAHLDPRIALSRALSEMNQFVSAATPDGNGRYLGDEPSQVHWWSTATTVNQPYLVPLAGVAPSGPRRWDSPVNADLIDDLAHVRGLVESVGMEMHVLDQTRPDVGLPVVKVIVPGMRHFWSRFGPGRLYDVPVALGWLAAPTAEPDLNPIPIFI